jgi:hypothetical protein
MIGEQCRERQIMAFCAICGRQHELGVGCLDGTGDITKKAGASSSPKPSSKEFQQTAQKADRWFLKVLLFAFVVIVLLYIVFSLLSKT